VPEKKNGFIIIFNSMSAYIIFKYIHLLSVITMICCLAIEFVLLKPFLIRSEIKRISRVDAVYGLAAILAVGAGLTLWFGVGKGPSFYNNPVLHLKVGLVIIVGLISIFPTIYFIRKSKGEDTDTINVPKHFRRLVFLQLAVLFIVPLLALLMANGYRF
jgi:putative membrane protein